MITLTVLGCDGSFAGPGGACSGYLVQGGGANVWVDAGPGSLANLQRHLDLADLTGIVLSHAHPDHWVDVLPFHNVVKYIRKRDGVPVWSPARVREQAATLQGKLGPAFDWVTVHGGQTVDVGGLRFTFSRTDHGPETLAMRVDDEAGASLGYSADTGPGWSVSELGPALGLALVEATVPVGHERETLHLSGRQAGISAKAADARRLVITHVQPGVDREQQRADAEAAFGAPVAAAAIDERYEIT